MGTAGVISIGCWSKPDPWYRKTISRRAGRNLPGWRLNNLCTLETSRERQGRTNGWFARLNQAVEFSGSAIQHVTESTYIGFCNISPNKITDILSLATQYVVEYYRNTVLHKYTSEEEWHKQQTGK